MSSLPEYTIEGFTIFIERDEMPIDPRSDDTFGTLVLSHKRYELPHECAIDEAHYSSLHEIVAALKRSYDAAIVLPVWGYIHSGLFMTAGERTYPFNDCWDAGVLGVIFCTHKRIREEYGRLEANTRKKATQLLIDEVETYSAYYNGDVYGYVITAPDGEEESCWGYYDFDECKQAAECIVRAVLQARATHQD